MRDEWTALRVSSRDGNKILGIRQYKIKLDLENSPVNQRYDLGSYEFTITELLC